MRVGVVVYGPLDRRSGGYLYDRELADRLEARGDEVVTVSLPERPYPARLVDNVDPRHVQRLAGADLDVLVEDELCHPSLALTNRRLDVDCPIVSLVHHLSSAEPRAPWRNRAVEALEREFLRSVDAHVCTSRTTRSSVAALTEGRRVGERWLERLGRTGATSTAGSTGTAVSGDGGVDTDADGGTENCGGLTGRVTRARRGGRTPDHGDGSPAGRSVDGPGSGTGDDTDARIGDGDESDVEWIDGTPALVAYPGGDRFGDPPSADRVRRRAREGPFRVLFVGNVTPRKRLGTLVEGLARVDGDWELTVVGDLGTDPDYVDRVRDRIDALGVGRRVRLAGRLDDGELAGAFATHHVLAGPSEYEGFGIVYVEAMGFGLPAIASTRGGAGEVVRNRENGRLVEPGDASAITDVLSPLCRDRERLAEMGLSAVETYRRHPSWEETADRIRAFLADVVDWHRDGASGT